MRFSLLFASIVFASAAWPLDDDRVELTVASWNVENFFDTRRDSDSDGEPVLDEEQMKVKFSKLSHVIRTLKADIVALEEVENRGLLRSLCRDHLKGQGYDYFTLIEETDPRGIDVALIAKRPFLSFSFATPGHTRGLLACRFMAGGEPFYVLVNHWKSRRGGGEETRMACAKRVVEVVNDVLPKYEGRAVPTLVVGDFNDEDDDESVKTLETAGLTNTFRRVPTDERWTYPWWDSANKKVHYQHFDHVFTNGAMLDGRGVDIVPDTTRVVRPPFMKIKRKLDGVEYDWIEGSFGTHIGHSDHFPVEIKLRVPPTPSTN